MQQMILPSTPITPENYHNFMEKGTFDAFKQKNGLTTDIIPGNRLYLSTGMCKGTAVSQTDLKMVGPEESKKIKLMIDTYGKDVTFSMADVFNEMKNVASVTIGGIETANNILIKKTIEARNLAIEHQKLRESGTDFRSVAASQAYLKRKIDKLKNLFQFEVMKRITKRKQFKKLKSVYQKYIITNSSSKRTKFYVRDSAELKKLLNLSRQIEIPSKGMLFIDIFGGVFNVANDVSNGKSFYRSTVSQAASIGFSAVVSMVGFAAVTALASTGVVLTGPFLLFAVVVGIGSYATMKLSSSAGSDAGILAKRLYDWMVEKFKKSSQGKRRG